MNQINISLPPVIISILKSLLSKVPNWARIAQVITVILTAFTGLPSMLVSLGIQLTPALQSLENKTVAICSVIVTIILQLTTDVPALISKTLEMAKKGISEEVIQKSFMILLLISTLFLGSCNHKPVSVLPAPIPQLSLQFDNWALGSDSINMVPNYQGINLWYSCNNDGGLSFYCIGFIQNGTTETGGPQPFTNGISTDTVKLLVLDSTLYFKKNSYNFTYIYSAKKH